MLPSFFDSVLQLIVRTSTDLPPDVRAAMKTSLNAEPAGTRASQAKTLAALEEHGAVYLNAIGGAAQFYARTITGVDGVSLMEFGTPEAMWHLTVKDFPAIVTMDAHGNSLHKDIEQESGQHLESMGV
jgi:tartrate dehydratase beta subunit/fumarate hydratase class I family protein